MARETFSRKDLGLRRDVRLLGDLLGGVLREQEGDELFERVERSRRAAIRRRSGAKGAEAELDRRLSALPPEQATLVVQAFSNYFGLVNLAERIHRIRRRREYLRPGRPAQPGSLAAVLRDLRKRRVPWATVRRALDAMRIEPVFTAHPTEAVRPALLKKEQRIARALVDRIEQARPLADEEEARWDRIREEVTAAWQTEEHPAARPTVLDEVDHVLFYLREVVYRITPPFYEEFERVVRKVYGESWTPPAPILRFGSWVGGDLDGNPFAGPDTIRAALRRQRAVLLRRYASDVEELGLRLSQSGPRVGISRAVAHRIDEYRELLPNAIDSLPARNRDMPYRVLLHHVRVRIQAAAVEAVGAYTAPAEFRSDLMRIHDSLAEHRGEQAGLYRVRRLLRRLDTFGFHLATLDVREDALVLRRALAGLLGDPDFASRSVDERTRRLENALSEPTSAEAGSDETRRALDVMLAVQEAHRLYGPQALGPFIVSMAHGPDDALAPLVLARAAGFVDPGGRIPMDVAPLFETVDDLAASSRTLQALLANPLYRRHLEGRNHEQVVMLGYSDSSKDGGIGASRWALHRAQIGLVESARAAGVRAVLFHGRGGTASRGGSKPREAVLAEPPGAIAGRLRLTEQGEIIHAKYGLRGVALRTLELMAGAVLEVTAAAQPPRLAAAAPKMMELLAERSRRAYRGLVYEDPDFYAYFRQATPIDVIERMQIGSRPASRREQKGIGDLRAIPWVFAWTQSRHLLPGWYGIGTGLKAVVSRWGLPRTKTLAKSWPFFANLLADVSMAMAKADLSIASRYAALAGSVGERLYPRLVQEFELARRLVCRIRGERQLLDHEPVLQRAIRLRNPYVDPMSLIQVDLLRRWREGGRRDEALERALFSTVKGIARGLQNTG